MSLKRLVLHRSVSLMLFGASFLVAINVLIIPHIMAQYMMVVGTVLLLLAGAYFWGSYEAREKTADGEEEEED